MLLTYNWERSKPQLQSLHWYLSVITPMLLTHIYYYLPIAKTEVGTLMWHLSSN